MLDYRLMNQFLNAFHAGEHSRLGVPCEDMPTMQFMDMKSCIEHYINGSYSDSELCSIAFALILHYSELDTRSVTQDTLIQLMDSLHTRVLKNPNIVMYMTMYMYTLDKGILNVIYTWPSVLPLSESVALMYMSYLLMGTHKSAHIEFVEAHIRRSMLSGNIARECNMHSVLALHDYVLNGILRDPYVKSLSSVVTSVPVATNKAVKAGVPIADMLYFALRVAASSDKNVLSLKKPRLKFKYVEECVKRTDDMTDDAVELFAIALRELLRCYDHTRFAPKGMLNYYKTNNIVCGNMRNYARMAERVNYDKRMLEFIMVNPFDVNNYFIVDLLLKNSQDVLMHLFKSYIDDVTPDSVRAFVSSINEVFAEDEVVPEPIPMSRMYSLLLSKKIYSFNEMLDIAMEEPLRLMFTTTYLNVTMSASDVVSLHKSRFDSLTHLVIADVSVQELIDSEAFTVDEIIDDYVKAISNASLHAASKMVIKLNLGLISHIESLGLAHSDLTAYCKSVLAVAAVTGISVGDYERRYYRLMCTDEQYEKYIDNVAQSIRENLIEDVKDAYSYDSVPNIIRNTDLLDGNAVVADAMTEVLSDTIFRIYKLNECMYILYSLYDDNLPCSVEELIAKANSRLEVRDDQ